MSFSQTFSTPFSIQSANFPTSTSGSNPTLATSGKSILFIDAGVDGLQSLVNGAAPGTEVCILQPGQDAISQMTNTLRGNSEIASLQIISHGKSGGLKLGESWLDLQSLPGYVGQLKAWREALSENADILLYGCNVAADGAGKAFVNLLAQVTGADVAASEDVTGNAALGGDWELEYQTGLIRDRIEPSLWAVTYDAILPVGVQAVSDTYTLAQNTTLTTEFSRSILEMTSPAGDYIGQGRTYYFDWTEGNFSGSLYASNNWVSISYDEPIYGGSNWTLSFGAPSNQLLVGGQTYLGATRLPFQAPTVPGLSVSGEGRGSNTLTGQFTINSINYGTGQNITSLDASFEQRNEGQGPPLVGRIRYGLTNNNLLGGVLTNDYKTRDFVDYINTTNFIGNITATLVNGPSNGQLAFNSDGSFSYSPNPNFSGSDTFTYQASFNGQVSTPTTVTLNVTAPPNPAPTLTPGNAPIDYVENAAAVLIDPTMGVTDSDSANFDGGTLTVRFVANGTASDRLAIRNEGTGTGQIRIDGRKVLFGGTQIGTYIGGFDNEPLVITFNPNATPTATQALIRNLTYSNTSDNPSNTDRTLSIVLTDGDGSTSTPVTKTITVTPQNDAPLVGRRQSLYDGTSNTLSNWTFSAQNVVSLAPPTLAPASVTPSIDAAGVITLNTTSGTYVGYSRTDQVFDANAGFLLNFQAQVLSETQLASANKNNDGKTDRAVFSLTLVTNDPTKAIELGFTKIAGGIRIFAQEDGSNQLNPALEPDTPIADLTRQLFTQAEGVDITTSTLDDYSLYVKGDTYTLLRSGNPVLSGKLRNYTTTIIPAGFPNPYTIANLISFSDNTPSISGQFQLGQISLINGAIAAQTIAEDTSTNAINFGLFDVEGNPLTLNASGNNTTLVPNSNIVISGTGSDRSVTLTPAANQDGTASITLSVFDGSNTTNSPFNLTVTPINDAPIALTFTNTTTSLAENTATTNRIKVADITIIDDALGTNNLSLTGTDAASFELDGNSLYLKANTNLDFETKSSYSLEVTVNDPSIVGSSGITQTFNLNLTDINDNVVPPITNSQLVIDDSAIVGVTALNLTPNRDQILLTLKDTSTQQTVQKRLTYSANFPVQAGQTVTLPTDWEFIDSVATNTANTFYALLHNQPQDEVALWTIAPSGSVLKTVTLKDQSGKALRTGNAGWKALGMIGANQDGILDVAWYNADSDEVGFWYLASDGETVVGWDYLREQNGNILKTRNRGWEIQAMADFDRNGSKDFFFRLRSLNQNAIVRLDGNKVLDYQFVAAHTNPNLTLNSVVDSNNDGVMEITWSNQETGTILQQTLLFQNGSWNSQGEGFNVLPEILPKLPEIVSTKPTSVE